MPDSYLDALNSAQRAAVEYCDGPELVIAGAGSGKTRVITYKIVHLLSKGLLPWNILALTFTNKAAREMQERISAIVGTETAQKLWMGTFHSIFSRILRRHADRIGFNSNFTIYDAADSKSLIKTILKQLQLDDKIYRPGNVQAEISNAKNALLSPTEYAQNEEIARSNRYTKTPMMPKIYHTYSERCRIAGAMDFDDLLYFTYVLFRDNPDLLEHYRKYFAFILVDEYQDTNRAQHLVLSQLSAPDGKICVVGDDAQSIYSFRGANIRNILDLRTTYPGLRTFKLEENYRSTQTILNAANSLISANKEQIPKDIYSNGSEGDPIELTSYIDPKGEATGVAARLIQLRRRLGIQYSDIAILYRTNAQSRELEEAFRSRNIPYRVYGGLSFFQRKEIKDAIAYFRLIVNRGDDTALERIINEPKRGIGETTVKKMRDAALFHNVCIFDVLTSPKDYGVSITKGTQEKINTFTQLIRDLANLNALDATAYDLASAVMEHTGLMRQYESANTPENISKIENLRELMVGIQSFVDSNTPDVADIGNYLNEVALLTDTENSDDDKSDDFVTFMTIHASKGLEYEVIFLVGVEDQFLPSERCSNMPSEIEEERRLMYVAITRAKQHCLLSYTRSRMINGKTSTTFPSRFIRDIDDRYIIATGGTRSYSNPRSSHNDWTQSRSTWNSKRNDDEPQWRDAKPRQRVIISSPQPTHTIGASSNSTSSNDSPYRIHSANELSVGDTIDHSMFHLGKVLEIDTTAEDHSLIVQFDDGSKRKLLLKYARFIIKK